MFNCLATYASINCSYGSKRYGFMFPNYRLDSADIIKGACTYLLYSICNIRTCLCYDVIENLLNKGATQYCESNSGVRPHSNASINHSTTYNIPLKRTNMTDVVWIRLLHLPKMNLVLEVYYPNRLRRRLEEYYRRSYSGCGYCNNPDSLISS